MLVLCILAATSDAPITPKQEWMKKNRFLLCYYYYYCRLWYPYVLEIHMSEMVNTAHIWCAKIKLNKRMELKKILISITRIDHNPKWVKRKRNKTMMLEKFIYCGHLLLLLLHSATYSDTQLHNIKICVLILSKTVLFFSRSFASL